VATRSSAPKASARSSLGSGNSSGHSCPRWCSAAGQERGLRPGTLAVHLIVGLGLAAELALAENAQRSAASADFKLCLLHGLAPLKPVIHGDQNRVLPTTVNLSIPGIDSEAAILALKEIVAISNGSACTSAGHHPSHVLKSMRLDEASVAGALRWSWCHSSTQPPIESVLTGTSSHSVIRS
jgi:cysteine desulfurase